MSSHQESGDKSATSDTKRPTDSRAAEDTAEAAKIDPLRQKLALVGHYAMLGLAPFISVCALIVAVLAVTGNQSGEEQLSKSKARIDSLSTTLSATKSDLEKLKASITQDKALQEEERKKQEEQVARIIQNITPLQMKLKISPTLEDQLRQAAATSAVMPAATSGVPAISAVAAAPTEKPLLPQVKVMKDAIDKYNKNN